MVSLSLLTVLCTSLVGQELTNSARAASLAATPGSAAHVQALLAEARTLMRYDLHLAMKCAEQAQQLAGTIDDQPGQAMAFAIKARIASRTVGPDASDAALKAARGTLPHNAPTQVVAEIAYAEAVVHWTRDRPPECLAALRQALELAEQGGLTSILIKSNILALSTVGWPENPVGEAERWLKLATEIGDAGLMFESRLLLLVAKERSGTQLPTDQDYLAFLDEAIHLGDRGAQIYLSQTRANNAASADASRALELLKPAIAAAETLGDREQISITHEYAARLLLHLQQPKEATREIQTAINAAINMGMVDRELMVTQTAAHIASRTGRGDDVQTYSDRIGELNQIIASRATQDQRAQMWRDANKLRGELRRERDDHATAMADVTSRQKVMLLIGASVLCLLFALASGLLLRSHRRLAKANGKLASALDASRTLQDERRALELNIRQLERLDSIGLLAGGFAHDFNNILVPIRGNAQLLSMDNAVTEPQRKLLDQILHASERAAGLCSDILSYARAEPTRRDLIDMRDIVMSITPIAQSGFGASIAVTTDLGSSPLLVKVDRSQIEQVLLNVLINAGDAIHVTGDIHISVDEQRLEGTPPGGYWFGEFDGQARDCIAVSVLDNGQGMTAETIRRIFDPFFTTRFAGRGLGLAGSFSILRRHKGLVEVQSEYGKGTQFTIYLPKHMNTSETADEPTVILQPAAPIPTGVTPVTLGATILVVDDESAVCEVVRSALANDGHIVHTASNGIGALAIAEQYSDRLDLALLDVTMPNMDGPSLARQLQSKIPGIVVIMMTGHAESAVRTACHTSPLILKPFDLPGLRSTVNKHLTIGV